MLFHMQLPCEHIERATGELLEVRRTPRLRSPNDAVLEMKT
jgi:hypothetical protein